MLEEVPNFPSYLMDRHMNWHTMIGQPAMGGRVTAEGQPGSGADFLDFHHQFVLDFRSWYDLQPVHDDTKLTPWASFPQALIDAHPTLTSFQDTAGDGSGFATEDALGIYIEPHHDSIHGWIAALYDQPEFGTFDSCKYFVFYQWHGLVDSWRQHWLTQHKVRLADVVSTKVLIDGATKPHIKDAIDVHPKIKDLLDSLQPPHIPKPKDKDAEVPVGGWRDPMIDRLALRVAELEAANEQAFIRPEERPDVG